MTDLAPQPLTVATHDDRAIPSALVQLAVQAIRHGAHRVSLLHESLDHDFGAPIGWLLSIMRTDPFLGRSDDDGVTLISVQVDDDEDIATPEWLAQAIAAGDSQVEISERLVELFEAALSNGWAAAYDRKEFENQTFRKTLARYGNTEHISAHELHAHATNWNFDADSGIEHVSTVVTMSLRLGSHDSALAFATVGRNMAQVTAEDAEQMLRSTAPDFVQVARFDVDSEEWIK